MTPTARKLLSEALEEMDEITKTGVFNIEGRSLAEVIAVAACLAMYAIDSSHHRAAAKRVFDEMIDGLYHLKIVEEVEKHLPGQDG